MLKWIAMSLFAIYGWRKNGTIPTDIKKCVVVGGPHTSNFDLFFAMAGFYKMDYPVNFLIKKEWLKYFPLKQILLSAGALGIDRSKSGTMVDAMAELLVNSKDDLAVLVTPEGTRKHTCKWKTGFYQTALKASVPIVLTYLDYAKKEAGVGPNFMPTGDYKKDMQIIREFYKDITPKFPENFCLKIYVDEENPPCS